MAVWPGSRLRERRVSAVEGGTQGAVGVVDEPQKNRLLELTFGAAAEGVWRNPVLLLIAIGVAFVTLNGVRPIPGATVADIAFALATVLLVPLILVERPSYFAIPRWFVVAVAGLCFTVLLSAAANSGMARNVVDGGKFTIALAMTPLIIGSVAASSERVAFLADVWIVAVVINSAVATTDFLGLTFIGPTVTGIAFANRATGLTPTPNHLGLVAAMAIPVAVSRALGVSSGRRRLAYLLAAVVVCFGILASGSRADLVAGAVGVVTLPLLHARARRQILLGFAAGVVVLALAAAIVPAARSHAFVAVHRLTGSDPSAAESDSERRVALREGLSEFRAHPLTGNGYGVVRDAHVMYLQLLDAGGILALPAFLVFAGGVFAMGVGLRRSPKLSPPAQNLAAALTASMVVWLTAGIVSNQIYDRYLYLPAAFLFGMWFASRRTDVGEPAGSTHVIPLLSSRDAGAIAHSGDLGLSSPRTRRAAALLAAVVAAVAAVGVYAIITRGDSGSDTASRVTNKAPLPSLRLLMQRDLDRYPSASPQHAMLAWWRSAQFADYRGFLDGFDAKLRRKLAAAPTTKLTLPAVSGFAGPTTVKFFEVRKNAGQATLYVKMRWHGRTPAGRLVTHSYRQVFRFIREDRSWRLRSDDLYEALVPALLRQRSTP
jgi:O-Antigen ligase